MEFIDFETRSLVDLKKVGAYAYARHPSTEIICMGYTKDAKKGNAVEIWTPYSKSVPVFSGIVCAWNAQFDYYIYKYAGVKKYGFTPVDIKYWYDLQAVAAYNNYPLSLDKCAKALGLDGKKSSGRTLINMLCKPSNGETFIEYDEQSASWFHEFYEYCRKDVQLLYDINRKLQVIPHFEMDTWRHTVKINERGLPMDRHELTCICEHVKAAQEKMDARTGFITGGVIKSVNQVGKLKEYLKKRLKINLKGVDKETITRLLEKSDLSKDVRILLETRKVIGLTSNKKFFKALEMLSNGAVHDTLQYYGAHTGRFSGRGFQLQNLNRKSLDNPEEIIDLLVTFNPDDIRIFYSSGEVLEITSKLVRSVIRAPEGHKFICADFSSIEAIAVPWVTGEWEMLDQFAKGFDLYKSAASVIFGVGYNAVNKELRQAGKLLVLACIAEGQKVLTDRGWIPIEKVTTAMKVWDGDAFVSHDGAVCRGYKEVMTYDGLQATPDHIIWTEKGGTCELQEAARKGLRLKRVCRPPDRLGKNSIRKDKKKKWAGVCFCRMPGMRVPQMDKSTKPFERKNCRLSKLFTTKACSKLVIKTLHRCKMSLRKSQRPRMVTLRRTRDKIFIPIAFRNGLVYQEKFRSISKPGDRSDRQQRPLRAGQSQICNEKRTDRKSRTGSYFRVQSIPRTISACSVCRYDTKRFAMPKFDFRGNRKTLVPAKLQTKRKVWDILNAGPNQRFTVEGRLVHNCGYAGGYRALLGMAKNYGVKMDDVRAKELVAQFRYARPKLTNAWKKFEKAAFQAINKPGRWFTVEDIAVPIMMQRVADELWLQLPCGRVLKYRNINITKAQFLNFQMTCDVRDRRQGITGANLFQNTIQALCRDILVEAQHRLEKAGYPIFLSVHDECAAMVPDDPKYKLNEFIEIMTRVPTWANGLPIKADGWEGYRYKK